jgi:iron complex transport system substrate-binding protein
MFHSRSCCDLRGVFITPIVILLIVIIAGPIAATGLAETTGAAEPAVRTVTDSTGREVEIPIYPERIVAAGNATLMVADALYLFPSAADRIVGITRISQARGNFLTAIDPDYGEKAVFERNIGPEQIVAERPDLVILKSFMKESLGDGVERLGIPVVYVDLETPEQYQRDLTLFGEILGEAARAQILTRYYRDAVDAVSARTASLQDRPDTLFIYANAAGGDIAFNVPPANWIQTTLVELAGGTPVWSEANLGRGWLTVGFEQIAAWNPDKIFLVSYRSNPDEIREGMLAQNRWQALDAVQNNELHVFPVDYYSWDQPDTRWAIGLQWLATKMHPELFADLDMSQVVYRFFELAYGMDTAAIDATILASLWGDLD